MWMPLYFIFVDGQKLFVDCGAGLLLYDLITVPLGFNDQVIPKRDNLLPKCDKKARGRRRAGLASEFPPLTPNSEVGMGGTGDPPVPSGH
jgi:hypothetical protein